MREVTKRYGELTAVDHVSLEVAEGEFAVLLGPSGSGKTTLLRMVNRMVEPTSGSITIGGRDTRSVRAEELRRSIGYVIQSTGLFPNMNVRRNIGTVPRMLGWERSLVDARVDELLDLVGLDPDAYGSKRPAQLSGGEAQRVGVARALAADPPVLLMDEPFGAVDPLTRERLQQELKRLQAKLRKTVVFVTHDIDEAVLLADRVALLRDGKLEQFGTPEQLWREPTTPFVREFFGDDLGLRMLSRLGVGSVLEPFGPGEDAGQLPSIGSDTTLKDALATLVSTGADRLAVLDEGQPLGTIGLTALIAALRGDNPR